jgi:hypothetical protein
MSEQFIRKPLSNFFIKKSLQLRLMMRIVMAMLVATVTSLASLLLVYFLKFDKVVFYMMDADTNLIKENVVSILLPSLIVSAIVNFVVAWGIGLYASRKYAVPIYKLEHWAYLLMEGKLTAKIRFREKEEMKELTDYCNSLSMDLLKKMLEIKKNLGILHRKGVDHPELKKIDDILATYDLDSDTIEIHTSHYQIPQDGANQHPAKPKTK